MDKWITRFKDGHRALGIDIELCKLSYLMPNHICSFAFRVWFWWGCINLEYHLNKKEYQEGKNEII